MANGAPELIWGFRVEGIGEGGADASNAQRRLLFASTAVLGHEPLIRKTASLNYEPWAVLEPGSIGAPSRSIEMFQAKNRWSSITFELRGQDRVAEKFLSRARRASFVLQSDISDTASTLSTDATGGSLENKVVYLRAETIKLAAHNGSGSYDIHTRGAFGSTASRHETGTDIFTSVPYWANRQVTLSTFHHGGGPDLDDSSSPAASVDEQFRWQGKIAEGASQVRGRIRLKTKDLLSIYSDVLAGAENRSPDSIRVVLQEFKNGTQGVGFNQSTFDQDKIYQPKTVKADASGHSSISADVNRFGMVTAGRPYGFTGSGTLSDGYTLIQAGALKPSGAIAGTTGAAFGLSWPDDALEHGKNLPDWKGVYTEADDVYEVMLFDRDEGDVAVTPLADVWAAEGEKVFGYHILALYAATHLSRPTKTATESEFDVLKPDWSLNLRDQYVSTIIGDIKELIRQTRWAVIDRAVLGWENDPVEIRKKVLSWFRAFGFYEGVTNEGELFVDRVRPIGVGDFDSALDNKIRIDVPSDALRENTGGIETTNIVSVKLGKTPVHDGQRELYHAQDPSVQSTAAGRTKKKSDFSLDLSVVRPSRRSEVKEKVIGRLLFQHFKIPRLTFQTEDFRDDSLNLGVGELVQLKDPPIEPAWVMDRSGERVSSTEGLGAFAGFVVRNQMNTSNESALSYELEVLFASFFGRWRAPSGIVRSVSTSGGDHVLTLEGEGGATSSFGDTQTDVSRFTVGDEVEIWEQDGTRDGSIGDEIKTIKAIDTAAHTITLDGTFSADPDTGDVVELAQLDTDGSGAGYKNTGVLSNVDRAYVWLADGDETIGDDNLDADEYGG